MRGIVHGLPMRTHEEKAVRAANHSRSCTGSSLRFQRVEGAGKSLAALIELLIWLQRKRWIWQDATGNPQASTDRRRSIERAPGRVGLKSQVPVRGSGCRSHLQQPGSATGVQWLSTGHFQNTQEIGCHWKDSEKCSAQKRTPDPARSPGTTNSSRILVKVPSSPLMRHILAGAHWGSWASTTPLAATPHDHHHPARYQP